MVSLEEKINYDSRISESPKLHSFNSLLLGQPLVVPSESMSEIDQIYFGLTNAIQKNSKQEFEKYYSRKSKSNPTKDSPSPFVNDDFLIFIIIVGVSKFSYDKEWIRNIVSIRAKSSVTVTFGNILTDDYYSKSSLPEIVFMYLMLLDQSSITNDFINFTFKKISDNTNLLQSRSDFQIICSLRAYESIIMRKQASESGEITLLRKFEDRFSKRIKVLSWILQAFLFFGLVYVLLNLPQYNPEAISLIDRYNYFFTVLGALGFTFLGNQIPFIRNLSVKLIMRVLGYPKELSIKRNKK